jgi:hypothetical protein
MDFEILVIFFGLEFVGLALNFTTLIFIVKSFDIKTHVFTLLFIDAVQSTIGSAISVFLDALVISGVSDVSFAYCTFSYVVIYFPSNFGAFLTMLIDVIRYYLARKSTKNIAPSKSKISKLSLSLFLIMVTANCFYLAINETYDVPYAILVEGCNYKSRDPRPITILNRIVLQMPSSYNIVSMVFDGLMLHLLQKTILPGQVMRSDVVVTRILKRSKNYCNQFLKNSLIGAIKVLELFVN